MTVEDEQEILRIVREELLLGTERPLPLDATLAELGLDSLAVVQFVTAVESTFGVDLTDRVLIAATPVTLREIALLIDASPRPATPAPSSAIDSRALPPAMHRIEVLEHQLAGRGWARRSVWAALRRTWPLAQTVFSPPKAYLFLSRSLKDPPLPEIRPPTGVELRTYDPTDRPALDGLWPSFLARPAGRAFDGWLTEGAFADVAVEGSRIVGLTVQSAAGESGRIMLRPETQATWGLYLREAPDARGRGIGLALLRFSLAEARDRGYCTNLTNVWRENAPMLAATTQLLGYRRIGQATRTKLFGLTMFSWDIEGRSGRGSRLTLGHADEPINHR